MYNINPFIIALYIHFFIPFINAQSTLTNQRLFDTLPYLQEHYAAKVKAFNAQPVKKEIIIFAGNSITEGANWTELSGDTSILNRGISGDITYGLLKRLDDIVKRQPSKLFIEIGINDIGKDIPPVIIADNCKKIVEKVRLKSPTTIIYIQSLLPVNPLHKGFPQHYDKIPYIIKTNELLKKMTHELNIQFINLYPVFSDTNGLLDEQYTYDGLHLNKHGYKQWIKFLKQNGYL